MPALNGSALLTPLCVVANAIEDGVNTDWLKAAVEEGDGDEKIDISMTAEECLRILEAAKLDEARDNIANAIHEHFQAARAAADLSDCN